MIKKFNYINFINNMFYVIIIRAGIRLNIIHFPPVTLGLTSAVLRGDL